MEPAVLAPEQMASLSQNFFSDIGSYAELPPQRLVTGVIFDFDYTLAAPIRPIDEIMEEGARNAEAYMRSTGMEFAEDFYTNIIEARRFALKKSEDEQEEHIADDAMSFLLQFFGYPASKMDPDVLKRAVDVFYAPEMTAWQLRPGVREMLAQLSASGVKLALLANYPCERVFQRIVDYLDIRQYFDVCICSASVEYRKPDEAFFNIVLERWDALPYEIVVVGDSLTHDIQGGLNLGALTVQLDQETSAQDAHDNKRAARKIAADEVIIDLSELPGAHRKVDLTWPKNARLSTTPATTHSANDACDRTTALPGRAAGWRGRRCLQPGRAKSCWCKEDSRRARDLGGCRAA